MTSSRFLALALASSLAACAADPAPAPTDASDFDGGACTGGCDDGVFCNGVEHCVNGTCMPGAAPCAADQRCNEAMLRCLTGCAIADADGDGVDTLACGGTDCDDADAAIHPGATEVCDTAGVDEDCDPTTLGPRDVDADGYVAAQCCNGATCGTDCDDTLADVHPGASETCNLRDDDCDGAVDESLAATLYYPDCDHDAFGDASATPLAACSPPTDPPACTGGRWSTIAGDCDDTRATTHPGALELCNGIDDDCSEDGGAVPAEDVDGDGHTATSYGCASAAGTFPHDDCDDTDPAVHPGTDFQARPRCSVGQACRRVTTGAWTCGMRVAGSDTCEAELGGGFTLGWDYDCNGTGDREPARGLGSCGCAVTPTCAVCTMYPSAGEFGCLAHTTPADLYLVTAAATCGANATYATCGGAACAACVETTMMLPQRCR